MLSIMHLAVELELLPRGTIPLATATAKALAATSATPIPTGVPMPFHQSPHHSHNK